MTTTYRLTLAWGDDRVDRINTPYAWFALSYALAAALRPALYPNHAPACALSICEIEVSSDYNESKGGINVP